ncbi:branched-chain amino acid ABC transporter permease [Thalassovita sp.]|jgi:branched-chain amino acid transport system permease protein|uniref:branched-chain amino acid ABC transporter permease n=1 Tax=Thalassovita sp. TaxID=1979401 RepID=UPI003B5B604B
MSYSVLLTWILRAVLALLVLSLFAVPFVLGRADIQLVMQALTVLSLAMLWNLLAGYSNLIVIGQHALVGTGAYAFFGCAILLGLPIPVAILGAMAVSLVAGGVILAIIFRLRAAYLAVGSWVVAEVFLLIASRLQSFGGGSGIALPVAFVKRFGSSNDTRQMTIYFMVLATALVIGVGIWVIMRSRIGLALSAMRDDEDGAVTAGVNLPAARMLSYLVVAPFTGLIGVLVTLQTLRISHLSSFSMLDWTIFVLFIVVIGGIKTLEGPILGTIVFFVIRQNLQDFGVWYLITLGALAVAVILIEPRGLWGLIRRHLSDDLLPLRHKPPSQPPHPNRTPGHGAARHP